MKITYFLEKSPQISETFISDLYSGLKTELREDFHVVLGSSSRAPDQNEQTGFFYSGYAESNEKIRRAIYLAGKALGRPFHWQMIFLQKLATLKLRSVPESFFPDVAFADYLTQGVLIGPYLRSLRIPLIVHPHGWDITYRLSDPGYRQALHRLFDSASLFVVASQHIRRLMELEGCPKEKIEIVRIGVNADQIAPRSWAERTPFPSVVYLGRLTPKKHPIALLHAFALVCEELPDARLTMIGDGPLRAECDAWISRLGLTDRVRMTGALPQAEAHTILSNHWVYAQHSVTSIHGDQEGFALSPAEAACYELPVVSTWHNGIPEHVIHEQTGFLVQEFDFENMGKRLLQLLTDPEKCRIFGRNGRKNVSQLCPPAQRTEAILNIARSLAR